MLMNDQLVNGLGIMSGIEQYFVQCAQGETLREFNRSDHEANGIMAGRRVQTWI
ncbi:MAG: hypothetical protein WD469_04120 [Paenibacillaceae bacterium]